MNFSKLARPAVLSQPVYEPGKPIDEVARELGLNAAEIVKLASNENPLGPSPLAVEAAKKALGEAQIYPDGSCHALRQRLAKRHGLPADQFVIGNGSNEIIELLGHVFLGPGDEAVMGKPAFIVYKLVTLLFGARPIEVPLRNFQHDLGRMRAAVTERTRLVFLPSPNNPTGTANSAEEIAAFVESLPEHLILVFDEAYAEYLDAPPDLTPFIRAGRPVICLRTFSKIFGLASLRIGYGYAASELIQVLNRVRQPFNANGIAQAAALAALEDDAFVERCARENRIGLDQLAQGCAAEGIPFVPSCGNFLLMKVGDGDAIFRALQRQGIIVRPMGAYGLPEYVRVTVGTADQNKRLLTALREELTAAQR